MSNSSPYKKFAWNGFSLDVPKDWHLSFYDSTGDCQQLRLEDDESIRMEIDWVTPKQKMQPRTVRKQYDKLSAQLISSGAELEALEDLASGWIAFLYTMPDKRKLLAAFSLFDDNKRFCFIRVHFESASRREPIRLMDVISESFTLHTEGPVPWKIYDLDFRSPEKFKLYNTSFKAGRKIFSFVWRFRRLFYIYCSLGDMALRNKSLGEWSADFLNSFPEIKGPRFVPDGEDGVRHVKTRRYPLGHIEEILRWCFKYSVSCRYDEETNQIIIVLFQYRSEKDLQRLLTPNRQQS